MTPWSAWWRQQHSSHGNILPPKLSKHRGFWQLNIFFRNPGKMCLYFCVPRNREFHTKERQFLVYFLIVRKIVSKIKNHAESFLLSQSKIFLSLPFNFFTMNQELNISWAFYNIHKREIFANKRKRKRLFSDSGQPFLPTSVRVIALITLYKRESLLSE